MADQIGDVFQDGLEPQWERINGLADASVEKFTRAAEAARKMGDAVAGATTGKGLNSANGDSVKATQDLVKATNELTKARDAERKAAAEEAKASREMEKRHRENVKAAREDAKIASELANEYGILSKAYNETALRAKNLQIALGASHPVAVQVTKDANEMGNRLKSLDASVGQYQRNVGNYASANANLQNTFRNIAGELPNLGISLRTFGQAISNNIGPAIEAVKQFAAAQKEAQAASLAQAASAGVTAKETALAAGATEEAAQAAGDFAKEQAIAAAQGVKGNGILKQLGASFFSLGNIIALSITLLATFGPKIYEAFNKGGKAAEDAEKANEKYKKSLESIDQQQRTSSTEEIARLQVLNRVATDTTQTIVDRRKAAKEMQDLYPTILGNLTQETILEGGARSAIESTTKAIVAKSMAQAASAKLAALGEKRLTFDEQQTKAAQDYGKALQDQAKAQDALTKQSSRDFRSDVPAFGSMSATQNVKNAADAYKNARKEVIALDAEQEKLAQSVLNYSKASQGLFIDDLDGKDPKAKTPPKPTDTTNELVNVAERLAKARAAIRAQEIEESLQGYRLIYENESNSFSERVSAFNNFSQERINQIHTLEFGELEAIDANLNKIGEIEKKAVAKRTSEEKNLLLQREAFALERLAVVEKYSAEEEEAARLAQAGITHILESETKKRDAILDASIVDLKGTLTEEENATRLSLAKRYSLGEISEKEYQEALLTLQNNYDERAVKGTIDILRKEIEARESAGLDASAARKKLAAAEIAFSNESTQKQLSDLDKIGKKRGENERAWRDFAFDATQQALNLGFDLLQTAAQSDLEKRLAGLDEEAKKIEQNKLNAIAAIEAEMISEEEKSRKKAELEAATFAKEQELESKRKIERRKAAAREKAYNIASIISSTALAVVKALADPVLVFPANVIAAAAAGVAGAAALARAIAAPLPALAEGAGINGRPAWGGGYALHSEAGPEVIAKPGQQPYLSTIPTIENLPSGTKVIPLDKMVDWAGMTPGLFQSIQKQAGDQNVVAELKKIGKKLDRQKAPKVNIYGMSESFRKQFYG